jgi:hypothetical protein
MLNVMCRLSTAHLRNDEEIYAVGCESAEAWAALRIESAAKKNLRMACCGESVVLRTSKLGTRHFAHARRGQCETAPETAEHLMAKRTVVEGIQRAGWTAYPEQSGKTPFGEDWRADVLAKKGKGSVAFEIRWSRQTLAETERRQQPYREANVRGLWLFKQLDFPTSKETPAFRLIFDDKSKAFRVDLPSPDYRPGMGERLRDARSWGQSIPLTEFVAGSLSRRLHFAPALGRRMPVDVEASFTRCWSCKEKTGIVIRLVFAASRILRGCPDIPVSIYSMDEDLPDASTEVTPCVTIDTVIPVKHFAVWDRSTCLT